jgi:hypothetical protein
MSAIYLPLLLARSTPFGRETFDVVLASVDED